LRAKRQDALRNEQRNMGEDILRWTQKEVFAITRKTLTDLADQSLEERMSAVFVRSLRALTGAAKEQLTTALKTAKQPVRVRSTFDLPAAQRSAIGTAVKETCGTETQIQFETAPEVVSGIELSVNGQKVAWSIADYLGTLQKSAHELLRADAKPELNVAVKPEPKAVAEPDPKREPIDMQFVKAQKNGSAGSPAGRR
jgi:F-type H+-transporting ATPase subunit b